MKKGKNNVIEFHPIVKHALEEDMQYCFYIYLYLNRNLETWV